MTKRAFVMGISISFLATALVINAELSQAQTFSRERISLNEHWRFIRGDPTNITESLLYDVRKRQAVRRLAEAESHGNSSANQAVTNEASNPPPAVIKEWILPAPPVLRPFASSEKISVDNGDPTSFVSFPSHDRKAFNGLCLVIVRGTRGKPGKIHLTANSAGLKIGTTDIRAIPENN